MAIAVSCPSCSASFKVKDEYAGKRAKCPKCGEPLTIPSAFDAEDTVKVPPPAAKTVTRPVAKPQPVEDEAEEAPKPKRRRDDDEDADEKPRAKRQRDEDADEKPKARRQRDENAEEESPRSKRRRDDEEDGPKKRRGGDDDDKPRSRRRSRDDDGDKPKKKSNVLVIVLSIVGGIVLLCGGGCAGVWFFVIKPVGDAVADRVANKKVTSTNAALIRSGQSLSEVEAILGRGFEADDFDVSEATSDMPGGGDDTYDRWEQKAMDEHVYTWNNAPDRILVAFSHSPKSGGTVVGVLTNFNHIATEPVKLAGAGKSPVGPGPEPAPSPRPEPKPNNPNVIEVTPEQLATDFQNGEPAALRKYGGGKKIKVSGKVTTTTSTGEYLGFDPDRGVGGGRATNVRCYFDPPSRSESKAVKRGDQVDIVGVLTSAKKEGQSPNEVFVIKLSTCKVEK